MDAEVGMDTGIGMSWREEVGAQMRAQREHHGLSIEVIAERLKLRASFVAAVEDGRGIEHMDEAYEWSHIKVIAGMLGIELKARG